MKEKFCTDLNNLSFKLKEIHSQKYYEQNVLKVEKGLIY